VQVPESLDDKQEPASPEPIDPYKLPPMFPVMVSSRVIGIGRNKTYELIKAGQYPVRVLEVGNRFKVSRYDLLEYLGADRPGRR
jgi:hypothetical protein